MQYLFTICDTAAGAYLPPFILPTLQMGRRAFSDCVCDKNHAFNKHPADYTLFYIGTWDEQEGKVTYHEKHESLGNGIDYVKNDVSPNQEQLPLEAVK